MSRTDPATQKTEESVPRKSKKDIYLLDNLLLVEPYPSQTGYLVNSERRFLPLPLGAWPVRVHGERPTDLHKPLPLRQPREVLLLPPSARRTSFLCNTHARTHKQSCFYKPKG